MLAGKGRMGCHFIKIELNLLARFTPFIIIRAKKLSVFTSRTYLTAAR